MSEEEEEGLPIVIDTGFHRCKAGFSGEDFPRVVFPPFVGRPKNKGCIFGVNQKDFYVGDEAQTKRGILHLKYPVDHGVVIDWDDMEKVWSHIFYDRLREAPEEHKVLLADGPANPRDHRERTAQIMFETFNVPALNMSTDAVLSLYSTGRTSGHVLDIGVNVCNHTTVIDGKAIPNASSWGGLDGQEVTFYLEKLLNERGYNFTTTLERQIVRDIKEKFCYVALDFGEETKLAESNSELKKTYECPDGRIINISDERFKAAEILFNPLTIGRKCMNFCDAMHATLQRSNLDFDRKVVYANIVLAGGTMMLPNMKERVKKEISKLVSPSTEVNVILPRDPMYCAWIGGSLLASQSSSVDSFWATRNEYEEDGPSIIHKKCS